MRLSHDCGRIPTISVILLFLMSTVASAQEATGSLYGTIVDAERNLLPGVSVTLAGMGASQVQISDVQGKFRFLKLDPGVWSLSTALEGYSSLEYPDIDIRAGRSATLELQMSAAVEDIITVTGQTPLLDERKLALGTLITEVDLESVPTAGDPWAMLNQAPGVMVDKIYVGGSRNEQMFFTAPGVDRKQNDWLIDGVQITDMAAMSTPTYYDLEQFDQVELITGGNDISKPTAGVSINMVTKRGTNELRGSARFLVTEDDLFLFFKQSSPDVDPDDFPPGQDTDIQTNQINSIQNYGFEAGGPVIRDRLWFWGSFGVNDVDGDQGWWFRGE